MSRRRGRNGTNWLSYAFPENSTITREEYRRRAVAGPAEPAPDMRRRCRCCDQRFNEHKPDQWYCSRPCRLRWQARPENRPAA
jgi:hypothetical protein